MLTGVHLLLTYACTYECDHCFLHCSPDSPGTFTIRQIEDVLEQARAVGSVHTIYFEGGEPFLYYPLLLHSAVLARESGFDVGIVTNAYWATSERDARIWLEPFCELPIQDLSVSDDAYHNPDGGPSPATHAQAAARDLGLPVGTICIEAPTVSEGSSGGGEKGRPVIGGDVRFRGRAVDKLLSGLPTRPWHEFTECPDEDLESPSRVHIDPFGNVHFCQGLCIGSIWERPLADLMCEYRAAEHPVCGPLVRGGPAALASEFGLERGGGYVDACHLCYVSRRALVEKFPQFLTPRQVYGLRDIITA